MKDFLWNMARPFSPLARLLVSGVDEKTSRLAGQPFPQIMGGIGLIYFLLLSAAFAFVLVWWRVNHLPAPSYAHLHADGSTRVLHPLSLPALTPAKVQSWASRAMKDTFSLNFVNMDDRLAAARTYYDKEGWDALTADFARTGFLETVRENDLEAVLTPISEPIIVQSFTYMGQGVWMVEMPVLRTYTGAMAPKSQRLLYRILVRQVPTIEDIEALAVVRVQSTPLN